jgi:hypothetical protein
LAQFVVNSHIRHHPLIKANREKAAAESGTDGDVQMEEGSTTTGATNPTASPTSTPATPADPQNLRENLPIGLPKSTEDTADEVSYYTISV